MMANLPWWTWALAAVVVLAIAAGLMFKRGQRLKLRIEPVPQDRIDNTPVERNEIVSPVRVKPRQAPTVPPRESGPAEDVGAGNRAETDDATPLAADVPDSPAPATDAGAENEASATPLLPAVEPVEAPVDTRPALTQNDLFADQPEPDNAPVQASSQPVPADYVVTLHVMSREGGFAGQLLLERLLQYGLRFGDMDIFHRHEFPTGHGMTLFSMAQALEPGTFDIDTLSRTLVPGVSFFMAVPGYKSLTAFDLMMDTARRLASELDGDLLDSTSALVTPELMAQWRDELAAFERHRLSSH